MGCCGRNRWSPTSVAQVGSGLAGPGVAGSGSVRLRWRRRATASVTGPVTGRTYQVSPERPVLEVDTRDAGGLLATGFFERYG